MRDKVLMLMTDVPGRITLEGGNTLDEKVVRELVTDSCRLAVGRLPKSRQPVAPHTYGRLV